MQFTRTAAGAFALAALISTPALAQQAPAQAPSAAAIAALRQELETTRREYAARMDALEHRLEQAEAAVGQAQQTASAAPDVSQVVVPEQVTAPAPGATQTASAAPSADASQVVIPDQVTADQSTQAASAAPPPAAASTVQNAYNPGIAVALNGFLTEASRETQGEGIVGFAPGGEIDRPRRGFSLGESEVSFAANIDPSFAGFMDFSIDSDNQVSLEEAYIRTTALGNGFTIKAGRFLSGIAYLNERHAHDWSFSDAPLPYRALLNTQLGDDGVQLRWLAPINQYLEFGAEAFRGDAYPAANAGHNGIATYTAFAKTGSDLGVSSSYLAGLSYVRSRAVDRTSGLDVFNGNTDLGIASFVYKWAPNGNATTRNFVLASEYFWGRDDGKFDGLHLSQSHAGWYLQGVYQFMPQWSAGLRASGLSSHNPGAAFAGSVLDDMGHSPLDLTALLEFDTSEFGRLRLQYTDDQATAHTNNILLMQYTVIYGPHGAHRY